MLSSDATPRFDRRVLNQYLGILTASITKLETVGGMDKMDFLADDDYVDIAQNRLRLAIESAADIARHLIARCAWGRPASYTQVFAILVARGVLPSSWQRAGTRLARLRNRLIHAYSLVTDLQTYQHVNKELPRLREYLLCVTRFIEESSRPAAGGRRREGERPPQPPRQSHDERQSKRVDGEIVRREGEKPKSEAPARALARPRGN